MLLQNVLDENVDNLLAHDPSVEVGLAAIAECNATGSDGVECVVMADLHVLAGFDLRTALADDNHARAGCLAISKFNAEVLRI